MENITNTPAAAVETTTTALQIPDFTPAALPWTTEDYAKLLSDTPDITKLLDSAIAPLVAAARGYVGITRKTRDVVGRIADMSPEADRDKERHKCLTTSTKLGSALIMPWYSLARVIKGDGERQDATSFMQASTFQARPQNLGDKASTGAKYLFVKGEKTVMDIHPSTDLGHINNSKTILFAEGLLKADAALSAYLAKYATPQELRSTARGDSIRARAMLRLIFERIPAEERVLIVGITSNFGWSGKQSEWQLLDVADREVWIGMDADVRTKLSVYDAAARLKNLLETKDAAKVRLLDLPAVAGNDGLDDVFATGAYTFDDLRGMLTGLPERPEQKISSELAEQRPFVDLEKGTTYLVKKRKDFEGETEVVEEVLAEMAIEVDTVTKVRSVFPQTPISNLISGRSSWIKRDRDQQHAGMGTASFFDAPLELLSGGRGNIVTIQTSLSQGRAGGAWVPQSCQAKVLDAWRAASGYATTQATLLDSNGLWVDEDDERARWVTSAGSLTSDGFDSHYRADTLGSLPDTDIPYMDPDTQAAEIVEAHETYSSLRDLLHPVMKGLFPTELGMMLALAVHVQPKGALATFLPRDSGKTVYHQAMMSAYGTEWGTRPAFALNGTEAGLSDTFLLGNSMALFADDARDKGEEEASKMRVLRAVVENIIRISHSKDQQELKKIQSKTGWSIRQLRKDSFRAAFLTGESKEDLNLNSSTVSRLMTFTAQQSKGETLMAGRGIINGRLEHFLETGAPSKVMGAWIVHNLRLADGVEGRQEQADAVGSEVRRHVAEQDALIAAAANAPGTRARDFLSPVVGALAAYADFIADLYASLGRHADAEATRAGVATDRELILAAYARHRELYGEEAETATETSLLASLGAAVVGGLASLSAPAQGVYSNAIQIGRVVEADGKAFVFINADLASTVLSKMGVRTATTKSVGKKLLTLSVDDKASKQRLAKGTPGVYGHRIPLEVWEKATGSDVAELDSEQDAQAVEAPRLAVVEPAKLVTTDDGWSVAEAA